MHWICWKYYILRSDYKIWFWKCDTVINNKPISWSQNRCGLSRLTAVKSSTPDFITWLRESQFMNVLFIRIEILTPYKIAFWKCLKISFITIFAVSSDLHNYFMTEFLGISLYSSYIQSFILIHIQNKSVYILSCYDILLN